MRNELTVYIDIMKRNFKTQLSHANNIEADYAVIVGKKEIESGKLTVKNIQSGEQLQLAIEEAIQLIAHNGTFCHCDLRSKGKYRRKYCQNGN